MKTLLARASVVLHAAPTYLVIASSIVTLIADEVAAVLPAGQATTVGALAVRVVGILGAAVGIIRRVTPVVDGDRGLLES